MCARVMGCCTSLSLCDGRAQGFHRAGQTLYQLSHTSSRETGFLATVGVLLKVTGSTERRVRASDLNLPLENAFIPLFQISWASRRQKLCFLVIWLRRWVAYVWHPARQTGKRLLKWPCKSSISPWDVTFSFHPALFHPPSFLPPSDKSGGKISTSAVRENREQEEQCGRNDFPTLLNTHARQALSHRTV